MISWCLLLVGRERSNTPSLKFEEWLEHDELQLPTDPSTVWVRLEGSVDRGPHLCEGLENLVAIHT